MRKRIASIIVLILLTLSMLVACPPDESEYRITYILVGGQNNPNNVTKFKREDLKITLYDPTKEGFTFDGWYSDSDFTKKVTLLSQAQNYVLYAKWVNGNGYALTFDEDFNGDELDMDVWNYDIGTGSGGWGNGELQYYTGNNKTGESGNIVISDGTLKIIAKREQYGGKDFTSARIKTKDNFAQTFGRFEARIKLPEGVGLWPAFWMMPQDSVYGTWPQSGEIDIMEARGREPDKTTYAFHYGSISGSVHPYQTGKYTLSTPITEWHVYAVEWNSEKIDFYVDDILMESFSTSLAWTPNPAHHEKTDASPFDQDFYIILNMAIGGTFDGGAEPDSSFTSATMEVDYVRVYK